MNKEEIIREYLALNPNENNSAQIVRDLSERYGIKPGECRKILGGKYISKPRTKIMKHLLIIRFLTIVHLRRTEIAMI